MIFLPSLGGDQPGDFARQEGCLFSCRALMHCPIGDIVYALEFIVHAVKENVAGARDRIDDANIAVSAFFRQW